MGSYIIIGFIGSILISSTTCMMLPWQIFNFGEGMSDFDETYIISFLFANGTQLKEITEKLPAEQAALVGDRISHLIESISVVKRYYKDIGEFNRDGIKTNNEVARKNQFLDITSKLNELKESAKVLDANFYGEPALFDLLAHNKNPATNCVTEESTYLISLLYDTMIDYELEKYACERYIRVKQNELGIEKNGYEETDNEFLRYNRQVSKLFVLADEAFEIVNQEIEKCAKKN